MAKISTTDFVGEVTVKDKNGNEVTMEVYQHENGGLFGVDVSFLEQNFDDDETPILPDPFGRINDQVELLSTDDQSEL